MYKGSRDTQPTLHEAGDFHQAQRLAGCGAGPQLWHAGLTPVELVPHSAVEDFQQRIVVWGCLHPISPSSEGFSAEKGYVEASPPSEWGLAVLRPLPSPLCC